MRNIRIGWFILCFVLNLLLIISVCQEWSKNGCEWWSLVIAGIFYIVGMLVTWNYFDGILYALQLREENREDELED